MRSSLLIFALIVAVCSITLYEAARGLVILADALTLAVLALNVPMRRSTKRSAR